MNSLGRVDKLEEPPQRAPWKGTKICGFLKCLAISLELGFMPLYCDISKPEVQWKWQYGVSMQR